MKGRWSSTAVFIFQAGNIKKQDTVRREPAISSLFFPGYIFNDAKLLSSIAPLQSIASSSLQRCGRKAFPGETATAEVQNRLPRRLESNIRASLGLTGCDIRIAAGYTIQYNTRKWRVYYAAVGAPGMDRLPGRDGLDLKTKNLHALVGHAAAFQILCSKLMMHYSDNLHDFIQGSVNVEGQPKIINHY